MSTVTVPNSSYGGYNGTAALSSPSLPNGATIYCIILIILIIWIFSIFFFPIDKTSGNIMETSYGISKEFVIFTLIIFGLLAGLALYSLYKGSISEADLLLGFIFGYVMLIGTFLICRALGLSWFLTFIIAIIVYIIIVLLISNIICKRT